MKIEIEVTEEALANFATRIKEITGREVTDAGALLQALLKADVEDCFESYAYGLEDWDEIYFEDFDGLAPPDEDE